MYRKKNEHFSEFIKKRFVSHEFLVNMGVCNFLFENFINLLARILKSRQFHIQMSYYFFLVEAGFGSLSDVLG